jgi:hypothetical protein
MHEDDFVKQVAQLIEKDLPPQYVAKPKANLYYQIMLDNNLKLTTKNLKDPKRGDSAFQTDLCIFFLNKDGTRLPKIVFEFKQDISTHDVIPYSNKAKRHKQIYPYLRYGLI